MIIKYLKKLKDNPIIGPFTIKGISETEIQQLEQLYNNGNPFPKVLKELLFLAGDFCSWLDFGAFDSQQEIQDEIRAKLLRVNGLSILRPHYFIDLSAYSNPVFMHLDEGDNPPLYQICDEPTSTKYYHGEEIVGGDSNRTLVALIERRVRNYKLGYGAF